MRVRLCTLLFLLAPAAVPQGTPSTDDILAKYVQALGGREALEKVSSCVMKGAMELVADDTLKGPAEVWEKAPDKHLSTANLPDYGIMAEALNGDKGWTQNPDSGVRDMSRSDLATARRDHDIHRELRLKELFPKMTVAGQTKLNGHDVFIVDASPSSGTPEKFYFDAQSGLLLKRDFEKISLEDGITQFEALYDDYRDVDGIKFPFTITQKTPDYSTTYRFTDVKINVPVDDAKFQKPAK